MTTISINDLTAQEFEREYELKSRPLIIKDAVKDWPALTLWKPDLLKGRYASKMVKIYSSNDKWFDYTAPKMIETIEMPFGEALRLIHQPPSDATHYYLAQKSLPEDFPEMAAEIKTPSIAKSKRMLATNLWYGSKGNITKLHYDDANNFLVQVVGRKKLILFYPEQYSCLYPTNDSNMPHVSKVNIFNPDLDQYPLFKHAVAEEIILNPGEVLYLPTFWWHQVESLDIAISVNFWWPMNIPQTVHPTITSQIWSLYEHRQLIERLNKLDTAGFSGIREIIEFYNEAGFSWISVLILSEMISSGTGLEDYSADDRSVIESMVSKIATGGNSEISRDHVSELLTHMVSHADLLKLNG